MRPRSIGTSAKLAPGAAAHDRREPGELVRLDVDKEIGRGMLREAGFDLDREIALDERDRRRAR